MDKQTTKNTVKQSPIMNQFVNKTFAAFRNDDFQSQHASEKKLAQQKAIEEATAKFLNSGKQVKFACVGLEDYLNPKTNKFGLQKVETFKTESELENSTFVETSKLNDESLKRSFSAKGISRYSYGCTRKPIAAKSSTRFEMLEQVRRNFKSRKNSNGTKGFISSNSAVVCGEKHSYEKQQKAASLEKAQERFNAISDSKKQSKIAKLTAKFSSIVAESLHKQKAEQEKIAKFESKLFAKSKMNSKSESKKDLTREKNENLAFDLLREKAEKAKLVGDSVTFERINTFLCHA